MILSRLQPFIKKQKYNIYFCAYKNEKLESFHCNDRFPIKITYYYYLILHNFGKPKRKNELFPQPHGFGNFTTVRHIIQHSISETTAQLFWIQPEQAEGQQDQPQQPFLMQCQWPHSCNCLIRWALVWSWCLLKVIECDFRIDNQLLCVWWKRCFCSPLIIVGWVLEWPAGYRSRAFFICLLWNMYPSLVRVYREYLQVF